MNDPETFRFDSVASKQVGEFVLDLEPNRIVVTTMRLIRIAFLRRTLTQRLVAIILGALAGLALL